MAKGLALTSTQAPHVIPSILISHLTDEVTRGSLSAVGNSTFPRSVVLPLNKEVKAAERDIVRKAAMELRLSKYVAFMIACAGVTANVGMKVGERSVIAPALDRCKGNCDDE